MTKSRECSFVYFICLAAFLSLVSLPVIASECANCRINYAADTDTLSVEAHNVSLKSLLSYISGSTGIEVTMPPSADSMVSIQANAPTAQVLGRLLRSENYALIYKGQGKERRVEKVVLMPKGQQGVGERLAPLTQQPSPASASIDEMSKRDALEKLQRMRESAERGLPMPPPRFGGQTKAPLSDPMGR